MTIRALPCVLMRAGTSRGPFFLRDWLPTDEAERNEVLVRAIGASGALNLDGLGGGSTLTSKVAIVSRSSHPDCDVDYLFAQLAVGKPLVDTKPNCGNMLSGVGPFAIEQGLVKATGDTTQVRIYNVNTKSRIEATVQTPGGQVRYDGDMAIDGVPGTGAPIWLNFLDAWGAVTGSVFPTGNRTDEIDGLQVTCIDAAMPMVMFKAEQLGVTGREKPAELDANRDLLARIEKVRLAAAVRMGLGDASQSVVPKPVIVSAGNDANTITSRYFTPWSCHTAHAVTGAVGVATAFAMAGTVAYGGPRPAGGHTLGVLHPGGRLDVQVQIEGEGHNANVTSAALVRTARKVMQGELYLPSYPISS